MYALLANAAGPTFQCHETKKLEVSESLDGIQYYSRIRTINDYKSGSHEPDSVRFLIPSHTMRTRGCRRRQL